MIPEPETGGPVCGSNRSVGSPPVTPGNSVGIEKNEGVGRRTGVGREEVGLGPTPTSTRGVGHGVVDLGTDPSEVFGNP